MQPPSASPRRVDVWNRTSECSKKCRSIAGLEERGVTFHDYDLPGFRTVNHVCVPGSERAAWFSDPEGNILCIHENVATT